MIATRKIKLAIVENRENGYNFIRNELSMQNKALNVAMNHLYFNYLAKEKIKLSDETHMSKIQEEQDFLNKKYEELREANTDKKREKAIKSIELAKKKLKSLNSSKNKEAARSFNSIIGVSEQTNLRDIISNQFCLMSDTKDGVTHRVFKDFSSDIFEILKGERAIRIYKKNNPLFLRGRTLKFFEKDDNYYIRWWKGIVFKCVLSNKRKNSLELENILIKVINKEYKICDSSLSFDDNILILNLVLDIPVTKTTEKVNGRTVGVIFSSSVPIYCVLNDREYIEKSIGNINDILKSRQQIKCRRERLIRKLNIIPSGKIKKEEEMSNLKEKERKFSTTYNHYLSSNIIKFAVTNKAEQINIQLVNSFNNISILNSWNYTGLYNMIQYKAERVGIKVNYIKFNSIELDLEVNNDYNIARNIAKSNNYIARNKEELL